MKKTYIIIVTLALASKTVLAFDPPRLMIPPIPCPLPPPVIPKPQPPFKPLPDIRVPQPKAVEK